VFLKHNHKFNLNTSTGSFFEKKDNYSTSYIITLVSKHQQFIKVRNVSLNSENLDLELTKEHMGENIPQKVGPNRNYRSFCTLFLNPYRQCTEQDVILLPSSPPRPQM
jgi:hypothetical protein